MNDWDRLSTFTQFPPLRRLITGIIQRTGQDNILATTQDKEALENNFDKDKIRDQLETQTQAVALGTQAMDAWRTSKLSDEKAKIRAEMEAKGELKGLSDAQINAKIEQSDQYKKVDEQYGVGSEFWRNGTAITGLLAGVLGGNVTSGMAAGAAPYVAGLIKDAADGYPAARIALHTLASAVLVKAQGGNVAAGAAGGFIAASSSEALSQAFYGKNADKLSPEEKTVISNLVTALGAAGGSVAGGGSQGIGSGANAARVEVENNSLTAGSDLGFWLGKTPDCDTTCKANIAAGVAKGNLITAGGVTIVAASAEVAVAVRAALVGCKVAPIICLNEASIVTAEALVPGGVGAGTAIGVGKTAAEAAAAKAEAVVANAVKNATGGKISDSVASQLTGISQKQLDKKFKHAIDFGIVTTKKNPQTIALYETAIKNHMSDTATVEKGTYGFVKDSTVFFNSNTNNAVVLDKSGEFITGFKVIPGTPQYDNYIKNGVLR